MRKKTNISLSTKISFFLTFYLALVFSASAGEVATNATVIAVNNTLWNEDAFEIQVSAENSICPSGNIGFPIWSAASPETHKRAYTAALTSLTTGMKVTVHSYQETDECWTASYIRIIK